MTEKLCPCCTRPTKSDACDCKPYWVDLWPSPVATITGDKPIHARDVDDAAERFVDGDSRFKDGEHTVYVFDGAEWFVLTVEIETVREVYIADCIPFTLPNPLKEA